MSADPRKPVPPRFEREGIVLRPLSEADLPFTLAWRNREGVRQRFLHSAVIAPEAHRAWFERYLDKGDDIVLVACEPDRAQPYGQVAIYGIDSAAGRAEVGRFVVAPEAQGRGLMRKAIAALVALAREELRLRTVFLEVFADNARAIGLYASLGFVETARRGEVVEMTLDLQR
jgi:RimJ/RimL family protein N-acetyltransferase